jgi:inosine-uridine nucleoside N-ribohydrolase
MMAVTTVVRYGIYLMFKELAPQLSQVATISHSALNALLQQSVATYVQMLTLAHERHIDLLSSCALMHKSRESVTTVYSDVRSAYHETLRTSMTCTTGREGDAERLESLNVTLWPADDE